MEMDELGCSWGSTLRVRVALNVNSPLKRALKLCSAGGEELLVLFTYECLPNFCYLCDKLGYIRKYCELHFSEGFVDPGNDTLYGPWLRVQVQPKTHSSPVQFAGSRSTALSGGRRGSWAGGQSSTRKQADGPRTTRRGCHVDGLSLRNLILGGLSSAVRDDCEMSEAVVPEVVVPLTYQGPVSVSGAAGGSDPAT
ncbi:UNVERIFIED_CONTAM: hypothetical protein Slati_4215000 [Sesamum latifolium]|uniref:Zinc knuckle CX2CX4HX4C domain-containing protein n=1 Tax=Sesamum latifolium TaxID=2727402 RepID=A0AAW2TDX1_9LAMI